MSVALFGILIFLLGCTSSENIVIQKFIEPDYAAYLNKRLPSGYESTKSVKILFATNRKTASIPSCSDTYYTVETDIFLKYGACEVSVPSHHDIGNLDYDLSKGNDFTYLFKEHKNITQNVFLDSVKKSELDEVILFIHGFNVKFEEAVLRAAQIKYDLKFPGEVILFTWPAGSQDGILNKLLINDTYKLNYQNALSSRPSFREFLQPLKDSGKKVHIIVHSMGHQVVLPSISELYRQNNSRFIQELVLNAPDFDSREFSTIVNQLTAAARRITVYCSPGDNALVASSKVNSNKRVGSCEKISGVDMINVNPVDAPLMGIGGLGHGYYSSRPVLTDLFQVILGVDVDKRLFIRKSSPENSENYVLRR